MGCSKDRSAAELRGIVAAIFALGLRGSLSRIFVAHDDAIVTPPAARPHRSPADCRSANQKQDFIDVRDCEPITMHSGNVNIYTARMAALGSPGKETLLSTLLAAAVPPTQQLIAMAVSSAPSARGWKSSHAQSAATTRLLASSRQAGSKTDRHTHRRTQAPHPHDSAVRLWHMTSNESAPHRL